jgi:hypothetical protein
MQMLGSIVLRAWYPMTRPSHSRLFHIILVRAPLRAHRHSTARPTTQQRSVAMVLSYAGEVIAGQSGPEQLFLRTNW